MYSCVKGRLDRINYAVNSGRNRDKETTAAAAAERIETDIGRGYSETTRTLCFVCHVGVGCIVHVLFLRRFIQRLRDLSLRRALKVRCVLQGEQSRTCTCVPVITIGNVDSDHFSEKTCCVRQHAAAMIRCLIVSSVPPRSYQLVMHTVLEIGSTRATVE